MLELTQENLAKTKLEEYIQDDKEKAKEILVEIARELHQKRTILSDLKRRVTLLENAAANTIFHLGVTVPCFTKIDEGIIVCKLDGSIYIDDNMF